MAGQVKLLTTTFVADAAVTRYQVLIAGTNDGHATPATTDNTGTFLGIADEDQPNTGYSVTTVAKGFMWAQAGGAIAYGASVIVGAGGTVTTATGVASAVPIGVALETAAEAGDIILISIN